MPKIECATQTLHNWIKRAEIDAIFQSVVGTNVSFGDKTATSFGQCELEWRVTVDWNYESVRMVPVTMLRKVKRLQLKRAITIFLWAILNFVFVGISNIIFNNIKMSA